MATKKKTSSDDLSILVLKSTGKTLHQKTYSGIRETNLPNEVNDIQKNRQTRSRTRQRTMKKTSQLIKKSTCAVISGNEDCILADFKLQEAKKQENKALEGTNSQFSHLDIEIIKIAEIQCKDKGFPSQNTKKTENIDGKLDKMRKVGQRIILNNTQNAEVQENIENIQDDAAENKEVKKNGKKDKEKINPIYLIASKRELRNLLQGQNSNLPGKNIDIASDQLQKRRELKLQKVEKQKQELHRLYLESVKKEKKSCCSIF